MRQNFLNFIFKKQQISNISNAVEAKVGPGKLHLEKGRIFQKYSEKCR